MTLYIDSISTVRLSILRTQSSPKVAGNLNKQIFNSQLTAIQLWRHRQMIHTVTKKHRKNCRISGAANLTSKLGQRMIHSQSLDIQFTPSQLFAEWAFDKNSLPCVESFNKQDSLHCWANGYECIHICMVYTYRAGESFVRNSSRLMIARSWVLPSSAGCLEDSHNNNSPTTMIIATRYRAFGPITFIRALTASSFDIRLGSPLSLRCCGFTD